MSATIGSVIRLTAHGLVLLALLSGGSATAGDFSNYPKNEWPTFGGDYAHTRFSQLAQINKGNVHRLELKWAFSTQLQVDPWRFFSTVPIVVNGVMYVTDPGNFTTNFQNVYAVDARTGTQIWHRSLLLDAAPENLGQFNVRSNRGAAFGNRNIYVATQDARLWALDAATGLPLDSFGAGGNVQVADVNAGFYLTAAPTFIPRSKVPAGGPASGRNVVLIGIAGAENETRGFMSAYDADTGDLIWRFFTVPAPTEFGGDTWPSGVSGSFADPFTRGGAAPWMSPAYDSELGLVIFGTGNAGPDFDGTHRAGENLFAASIIALDVRNGQRVWHFQEVHHDLWDYDQAAPPVVFEITRNGRPVKAVGAAGKTGWFYILDRKTGQPLIPCPERPVSTATNVVAPDGTPETPWPTQPFCESDAFVPQGGRILPTGEYVAPIFTPPQLPTPGAFGPFLIPILVPEILPNVPINDQLVEPGIAGGADWTPVSFNPYLGLAYIGGNVWPVRYTSNPGEPAPGRGSIGGWWSYTREELARFTGTLTAMDVATGKIRWQVQTENPAYGGTCATAGNLVFLGELDDNPAEPLKPFSYFSAYDGQTGARIFRFRIEGDAPVLAPCVTYALDGKQYIAFAAGGGVFYKGKGNTVYVLGLADN